ncbi:MAG: hypothetical protein ABSE53_04775 [Terracidiphilus sp.]|jgi:hypothetical protein
MTTKQTSAELDNFNNAMDTILRADPAKVKAEMDAEIQASKSEREARGERKRGRKAKEQPSASGHASSGKS